MKKNPFLILILLLISFVTNVSAANAPEDATLTVKMYNFYKEYPLEPELTYTGTIENITYSYKRYDAESYSSNCSNLTKDQLLTKLKSESANHYYLQVSCTLNGTTTTDETDFWIGWYSNNVRDYGGPGTEETITTFYNLHLDVDRCVLKDAGGNIIIKLVKGNSSYYHLYVAPGVQFGDYELPIYQINTAPQIRKLNVTVMPFKREAGATEYLPTLESALKELYTAEPTTIKITLLADYSGEETTFNINDGHDYILNLNGYNMSGKFIFNISKGSSLTINGDNEKTNLNAQFQIDYDSEYSGTIPNSLTINGGKYTTTEDYCIDITDYKAKVTLNGGIFQGAMAATNNRYQCLNHTEGHETAFYIYEDGIKYLVGNLGEGGQRVIVERCKIMPFKVEYSFDKYPLGQTNFTSYSGTALLGTFASTFDLAYSNENFNNITEGSAQCKNINATITLQCNYKSFGKDYITIGNDANIILDLNSSGCKMDAICAFEVGGTLGQYTSGCTLTIFADDYKTNLEGSFQVSWASNVTINGGTYKGTDYGLNVKNGEVTINNGTFSGSTATIHKDANGKVSLGDKSYYYESPNAKLKLDPQPTFNNTDGNLITTDKSVTVKKDNQAYAFLSSDGRTLTFKYDGYMLYGAYPIMEFDEINKAGWSPAWIKDQHPENITEVVFDDTFKDYSPTSCYNWFLGCKALRSINLENLKTDEVRDMSCMFYNCIRLESVDLSGCNTSKVIDMSSMFFLCEALSSVNLGGKFSTESVKTFKTMFGSCNALIELDLSSFDTKSLDNYHMTEMIYGLAKLKVIKLGSKFKPVGSLDYFASSCNNLETILVDKDYECNPSDFSTYGRLFNSDINLRGGNGTQCTSEHWADNEYFRIDGKDGLPGFLTTLPYSIQFVDVDEKGTKKVLSTSEYLPYDSEISFFANNPSEEFTPDVTIPTRDGYEFVGWSDSLNTGLTAVAKEVKINPATDRYNRIYKANWKKRITADIDGNISYPKDLPLYCDGKETTILLPFTITYGKATGFEIKFGDNQFSAKGEIKDKETAIVVNVPETLTSGVYKGELVFTGTEDPNSDPYPITLTANIVQDAAVQLYTDVLIADNHDGFYNAFQWYKDGEPLAGANLQYYTEPKFDYTKSYSVELSGDGGKIMSCPVKWLSTAKVLNPSVKVYPNPAKQNELFTLEILDFDETQNYDIVIFTANGTLVKKISNVEKQTSVSLPAGIYSGSLISGDDKKGFKLIVK